MKYIIALLIFIVTASACSAMPFRVKDTLMWDAVVTNVDGSLADDLVGYRVYWTTISGAYSDLNSLEVGLVTSVYLPTTLNPLKGFHCFVVTAVDSAHNESDFSNEICDTFPIKKSTPINMRLIGNE